MRFCPEAIEPVTTWTRASRRTPLMPMGSRMPPWSSTTNSCGRTWSTSRSGGSSTARAASMTRSTSLAATSRLRTGTTPCRLMPLMWLPADPTTTLLISQPAMSSASSTALRMASTVASMLTTVPFLSPLDACVPMPVISTHRARRPRRPRRRSCTFRRRAPPRAAFASPCPHVLGSHVLAPVPPAVSVPGSGARSRTIT